MAALTRFAACIMLLGSPAPVMAKGEAGVAAWRAISSEASVRFGIPLAWIERVMQAESAGHITSQGRPIRSRAGAIGLMQLMPGTWADMRERLGLGYDPDNPRDNIVAGTFYLRLMYDRFGYPGLFAAYNAGPQRYADYLAGRGTLPTETVAYLNAVSGRARAAPVVERRPSPPPLFAIRHGTSAGAGPVIDSDLFAVRSDAR